MTFRPKLAAQFGGALVALPFFFVLFFGPICAVVEGHPRYYPITQRLYRFIAGPEMPEFFAVPARTYIDWWVKIAHRDNE
jgi:hypothetical protein